MVSGRWTGSFAIGQAQTSPVPFSSLCGHAYIYESSQLNLLHRLHFYFFQCRVHFWSMLSRLRRSSRAMLTSGNRLFSYTRILTLLRSQRLQMFLLATNVPTNCDVQRRLERLLTAVASQASAPSASATCNAFLCRRIGRHAAPD